MFLGVLNIALYVVGMGFVFYTYREVKAWTQENPNAGYDMMAPLGGGMGGGMGGRMTQMTNMGANSNTQLDNGPGHGGNTGGTREMHQPFVGKGVVLG